MRRKGVLQLFATEAKDYWLATAPINRSHSSKLPRNPSSQAVCQLNCADNARRFPLFVSDKFW
jgi:hypothetical protein